MTVPEFTELFNYSFNLELEQDNLKRVPNIEPTENQIAIRTHINNNIFLKMTEDNFDDHTKHLIRGLIKSIKSHKFTALLDHIDVNLSKEPDHPLQDALEIIIIGESNEQADLQQ